MKMHRSVGTGHVAYVQGTRGTMALARARLATLATVAALAVAVPVALGDPPPPELEGHMEWVGTGVWTGSKWSEYGELELMGPRGTDPLGAGAEAPPAGVQPLFAGRGSETSTVDQWVAGENHWEVYSLTFDMFREFDDEEGIWESEAAPQYTITGNALYLGTGGIANSSGTTQIIENDIWLWDDTTIDGGDGLELQGEVIDTSRGKQAGETKNLTITGQVESWAEIVGAGDITFDDGFAVVQHAAIGGGGDISFEDGWAEVHADIRGDGDVSFTGSEVHLFGAIQGDGDVSFTNSETHLHAASTYTGQTTIEQTEVGLENTVQVFVGDDRAFGDTSGSITVIGAFMLGSHDADVVLDYDFLVQDGPDAGRIRFGVTDDNSLVQLAGVINMDNSDTTLFMEHAAQAHLHDTSEIRLGDATLTIDGLGASEMRIDGRIRGGQTGQDALIYDSLGTLILTGANDYLGDTRLQEGDVRFAGANAFGASENLYLEDGLDSLGSAAGEPEARTAASVHLDTNLDLIPLGELRFEGDWRILNAHRRLTILTQPDDGHVVFDEDAEVDLNGLGLTFAGVGTAVVDAAIVGDGTLIKAGSGTLRLTGENAYDGETLLRGGTLEIAGESPFGVGDWFRVESNASLRALESLSIDQNVELQANLTLLDGAALTFAGDEMTIDDDVVLRLNTTSITTVESTLSLDNSLTLEGDGDLTLDGQVTGGDGISHGGGGTLILATANDYSGGTWLTSGTTRVGDDESFGTGTVRIVDQANLGADVEVTLDNDFEIAGHLHLIEGEAIDFAGTVAAVSGMDPQITIANTAENRVAAGGQLVLNGHLTFDIVEGGQFSILGDISGNRNLVSTGEGTLAVGGTANSYGQTIIQAGQFEVLDGAELTTTALLVDDAEASILEQAEMTVTGLVGLTGASELRLDAEAQLNANRLEVSESSLFEAGTDAQVDVATAAEVTGQSMLWLLDDAAMNLEELIVDGATLRLDAGASVTPQEQLTLSNGATAMLAGSVNGLIQVDEGTLQLDGDDALADTTQVNVDGPTIMRASAAVTIDAPTSLQLRDTLTLADGEALTLDGPGLLVDQPATLAVSNTAPTVLGPSTVVTLDHPLLMVLGQDLDVEGSFTGAAALALTGPGTLRVHSDTSSIDTAFVIGGTLHMTSGADIDLEVLTVDGGTLRLDAGATVTPQDPLAVDNGGMLMLTGSVTGAIQVNQGTLRLDADTALAGTSDVHVDGPTSMFASTAMTIDDPVTLHLRDTLTLADGGALTLNGPSLLVDQPALLAVTNSAPTRLGADTTITLADTLTFGLNEDLDVEGRLTGGAGFVKTGAGTLRIHSDDSDPNQATIEQGLMHLPTGAAMSLQELNVAGGAVQLDAGSNLAIASQTRIANGHLDVHAAGLFSSGEVIVEPGGALRGAGSVEAPVTVGAGGALRPATSGGQPFTTLQIDGDLTLEADSRTVIRFDITSASDSVAVTGDSVIQDGARLVMDQLDSPAPLASGLRLPVMTAGSIDVDPEAIELEVDTDTLLRFSIELEDNPTLVVVTSRDLFAFDARGPNNQRLAQALDEIAGEQEALAPADRDAAMEELLAELNPQNLDDETFNAGLEAISPVLYTGIGQSQLQTFRAFHADMHRAARLAHTGRQQFGLEELPASAPRLAQGFDQRGWSDRYRTDQAPALDVPDTVPERRVSGFITGHGVYDRLASQDDRPGVRSNSHGFILGADHAASHELALGMSAGYTHSSLRLRRGRGSGRIHSVRVGPYATYQDQDLALDVSVSYGYHDTRIDSDSSFGSINDRKSARYDAHDVSAHVSASHAIGILNDQLTVSPLAGLDYTWFHREGFTERGDNTASSVRVDSDTTHSLQSTLGVGLSVPPGTTMLQPEAFVGWAYQLLDDRPEVRGQFVGHDPQFTVRGPRADRHALVVGTGLFTHWSEQVSTYVYYRGRFQSNEDTQAISAGLNWRF